MEFININDYSHQEQESNVEPTRVQYQDFANRDMTQYSEDTLFSFKDRPDYSGKIKRIEDGDIVFSMHNKTYKMPEDEFSVLFALRDSQSPQNWYTRLNK
jgi:hypothetical protein